MSAAEAAAATVDSSRKRVADGECDQPGGGREQKRSKTPLLEEHETTEQGCNVVSSSQNNVITLQQVQQRVDEIKRMSGKKSLAFM